MKLNKDGTIDGTPAEIAEYQRLMEERAAYKKYPNPYTDHTGVWFTQPVKITSGATTNTKPITFTQHLYNTLYNDAEK